MENEFLKDRQYLINKYKDLKIDTAIKFKQNESEFFKGLLFAYQQIIKDLEEKI